MNFFYQIFLIPSKGITEKQIEEKMNLAIDWYRFDNNWIVFTNSNAQKWYLRLQPFVKNGGNLFIVKLDISDYFGFMGKDFWNWIRSHLNNQTKKHT